MKAAMQAIENENMQYARRRWLILTTVAIAPYDAGVAAATINVGQQAGGSIGTSLLNTMVASATASYLASHLHPGTILAGHASAALVQQSLVHGYVVGFWWTAGIFAAGAVVCGTLLRRGPLAAAGTRRHGRGTKGRALRTTVRSARRGPAAAGVPGSAAARRADGRTAWSRRTGTAGSSGGRRSRATSPAGRR